MLFLQGIKDGAISTHRIEKVHYVIQIQKYIIKIMDRIHSWSMKQPILAEKENTLDQCTINPSIWQKHYSADQTRA